MSDDRSTTIRVPGVDLQLLKQQYTELLHIQKYDVVNTDRREALAGVINLLEAIFELYPKEMEEVDKGTY